MVSFSMVTPVTETSNSLSVPAAVPPAVPLS
jgi:hypothetical protein